MFENVAQLEQEVKDFRQNILASSELIKSIESLIAASKTQNETFAARSAELLTKIGASTVALQKSHDEALMKQIEENRALQTRLKAKGENLLAEMNRIPPEVDKRSAALISEIQKDTEQLHNMTRDVIEQLKAETGNIKTRCDELIKSLNDSNKTHITEVTAALTAAQQPYLHRLEETDASITRCEAQLSQKHEDFLVKLESTNVDQMFKICQEIKKSMDTRFVCLTIGVGASIVLMIISIFLGG